MRQHTGVSGRFKVVVRKADGSVRLDMGFQDNLILDNFLAFYTGHDVTATTSKKYKRTDRVSSPVDDCFIGTGNTSPKNTDTNLAHYVAKSTSKGDLVETKDDSKATKPDGYVLLTSERKYIFSGLNNVNVTEVGLAGVYDIDNPVLYTRALILDSGKKPVAVTVLKGEFLEVTYQLNFYLDTTKQTGEFSVTRGTKKETFEYLMIPLQFGTVDTPETELKPRYGYSYYTYGVKEPDNELTASYDLAEVFKDIKFGSSLSTDLSTITEGETYSSSEGDPFSNSYLKLEILPSNKITETKWRLTHGVATHNHNNGIRVYTFCTASNYALMEYAVIVKNKANGQGIKKAKNEQWAFDITISINRRGN